MKCTNRKILNLLLCITAGLVLCGCKKQEVNLENAYDVTGTSAKYGITSSGNLESADFFAKDLIAAEDKNTGLAEEVEHIAEGAGVFKLGAKEAVCTKNIYERLYPASTTKILTAYIALKYGNPEDIVTISANAANQPSDSSVCNLKEGDQISLENLIYGLILCSGNDAAVAIAEHISKSVEEFAILMNSEARSLGATGSHFVTPHGLHDEDHYTTVYDMYLFMNEAAKNETFLKILGTAKYTVSYLDAAGAPVTQDWESTNKYLVGTEEIPEGVTVIGGKTGTTNDAQYCLVQYNQNASGEPVISIVFKADSRENMYLLMSEMLKNFAN